MLPQLAASVALAAMLLAPASCGASGNTTSDPAPTCKPGEVSAHIHKNRITRNKQQAIFPVDICATENHPVYAMYVFEAASWWRWLQKDEESITNYSDYINIAVGNADNSLLTLFLVRDTKGDNCGRFWRSLHVGSAVYRKGPPKVCEQLAHATT